MHWALVTANSSSNAILTTIRSRANRTKVIKCDSGLENGPIRFERVIEVPLCGWAPKWSRVRHFIYISAVPPASVWCLQRLLKSQRAPQLSHPIVCRKNDRKRLSKPSRTRAAGGQSTPSPSHPPFIFILSAEHDDGFTGTSAEHAG